MTDLEYLKKYMEPSKIEEGIKKLNMGIPVQYIVGSVNFYGYDFKVNENVLIPRFETESLVYETIKLIKEYFNENIKLVDLGTGSGCIAITLKKEMPSLDVSAVDISEKALKIAKQNSKLNNAKIKFYLGDMLEPLSDTFDVIISNPPYIAYDEEIMDIVRNNEPHLALYADNEGLFFYEKILSNAKKYLNEKNLIAFEIGYKQSSKIKDIAYKYFPNCKFILKQDLSGKDRFVFIIN